MRCWNLGGHDLWADEIHTQLLAESSWSQILSPRFLAPYMPLYFLLAKSWSHWFGVGEAVLRVLPVLAGIMLIPAGYFLFGRMESRATARSGAFLLAVNPLMIYFSREHRMYSLYVLTLAVAAMACSSDIKGWKGWGMIFTATVAALYTFPFALFYSLAFPILFWKSRSTAPNLLALIAAWIAGIAWIFVMTLTAEKGSNAHYAFLTSHHIASLVKYALAGNFSMLHADLKAAAWPVIVAAGVAIGTGCFYMARHRRVLLAFWGAFLLFPLGIMTVIQSVQGGIYNYKSFLPATLSLVFLVATGLSVLPSRISTGLLVVLVAGNLWVDGALLDRSHQYNWKTSREDQYSGRLGEINRHPVSADAFFAPFHVRVLEGLYYVTPHGLPLVYDSDHFMESYPAYNRPSMREVLRRRNAIPLDSELTRSWKTLVTIGPLDGDARLPAGYAIRDAEPASRDFFLLDRVALNQDNGSLSPATTY